MLHQLSSPCTSSYLIKMLLTNIARYKYKKFAVHNTKHAERKYEKVWKLSRQYKSLFYSPRKWGNDKDGKKFNNRWTNTFVYSINKCICSQPRNIGLQFFFAKASILFVVFPFSCMYLLATPAHIWSTIIYYCKKNTDSRSSL
jgi:hypothetical protein